MNRIKLKVLNLSRERVQLVATDEEHACAVDIIGPVAPTRSGFERFGDAADALPFIKGNGALELACGKCGQILARQIRPGQLRNVILVCKPCGAYNDTETCGLSAPHLN